MPEKPKLEELIPQYLEGDRQKIALDFAAYMRANKMAPAHRPSLRYKCSYKGKNICTISLPRARINGNGNPYQDNEFGQKWMSQDTIRNNWVVIPQLDHLSGYKDQVDEGMKNIIWDEKNMYFCNGCWKSNPNFPEPREGCGPRPARTIFGREFKGLCGRGFFWFFNPDGAEIGCVKKLLELEQKARN